jgi:hypothetical protein
MTTPITDLVDVKILLNLGRISTNFNSLSHTIDNFIATLINKKDEQTGIIVACELRFTAKIAVLMALYKFRVNDPLRVKKFYKLMNLISKLETERNIYMHSAVYKTTDGKTVTMKLSTKLKKGFIPAVSETNSDELEKFSRKTHDYKFLLIKSAIDYRDNYWASVSKNA